MTRPGRTSRSGLQRGSRYPQSDVGFWSSPGYRIARKEIPFRLHDATALRTRGSGELDTGAPTFHVTAGVGDFLFDPSDASSITETFDQYNNREVWGVIDSPTAVRTNAAWGRLKALCR